MAVARVFIVRHGETEENRTGVMQGQQDTVLNEAGIEQARLTGDALENVLFMQAHSSDLSRAIKTAEHILERQRSNTRPVLQKHAALRERYMGDMEGQPISEWTGPLPENMEAAAVFAARADGWWKNTIVRYANSVGRARASKQQQEGNDEEPEPADNILVVSHGGLIRVLLVGLIGSRKITCSEGVAVDQGRLRCANASITVIEVDRGGKGTLVLLGDTTHLDGGLVEDNVDIVADDDDDDDKGSTTGST